MKCLRNWIHMSTTYTEECYIVLCFMKRILFTPYFGSCVLLTPLTLTSVQLNGQTPVEWRHVIAAGLAFTSGMSDGVNQAINHHYHAFKRVHPGASDQFWNPKLSWTNKYDSKLPLATTALVWTTDGHHLTRTLDRSFLVASLTVNFANTKKRKLVWCVLEAAGLMLIRSAGFHLTYSIIYK